MTVAPGPCARAEIVEGGVLVPTTGVVQSAAVRSLVRGAPDLLAACKSALGWYGLDGDGISDPTRMQLREAIAKAEQS